MEIFREIKEYPLYSISNEGRVLKNATRKVMKPSKKANGYMQINLFTCDGRRKKEYVHRLVALTFIPNSEGLPVVNHIDGIRDNNVVSNLEWVTQRENVDKSSVPKRVRVSQKNGKVVGEFASIQAACLGLGLTGSNVSACLHGSRQKSHKGYVFELI